MRITARSAATYLLRIVAVGVAYYVTATSGLRLDAVSGFATLVWPPTGIAIAALLLLGPRTWPAIALGAFSANYASDAPPLVAAGIALGNTGEALLAYWLLKKTGFRTGVDRVRDAVLYIALAAVVSTLLSPTVGVASLYAGGVVGAAAVAETWFAWWVGDVLGALVFGLPLITTASMARPKRIAARRAVEAIALAAVLLVVAYASFGDVAGHGETALPIMYLIFAPLLWAALRFGPAGASIAMLAVSVIAVWSTARAAGPFARSTVSEGLLLLQLFMGAVSAMVTLVAAEDAERRNAEEELRGLSIKLEEKVEERAAAVFKALDGLEHAKAMLERRGAVLQAVLHGIGEGVAAFDASGKPIVFNKWAMAMLGAAPADVSSPLDKLAEQFPTYYIDGTTRVPFGDLPVTRALRGETVTNERLLLKTPKHPKGLHVSVSAYPIREGQGAITGGVVVFREITEDIR